MDEAYSYVAPIDGEQSIEGAEQTDEGEQTDDHNDTVLTPSLDLDPYEMFNQLYPPTLGEFYYSCHERIVTKEPWNKSQGSMPDLDVEPASPALRRVSSDPNLHTDDDLDDFYGEYFAEGDKLPLFDEDGNMLVDDGRI